MLTANYEITRRSRSPLEGVAMYELSRTQRVNAYIYTV